ncbi:MAG: T9SS type A sorting domain-containing protein, partial [Chitinophagaceae bacterium]
NTAAGTVSKPNTGTFSIARFSNAGLVKGIGTIEIPTMPANTGRLEPGNSPGSIGVPSNFFTGKAPTLNLEIADGSGAGIGHDEVSITGAANLSGTIINIAGNDLTAPAGPYTVLTADANFTAPPNLANIHVAPGYTVTVNANNIVINKNIVLPVSWGDFDAFDEADKVRLLWSTVQEVDASHFIIEFSTDGSSFAPLAKVSASGNSNVEKRYNYSHNSPSVTGTNFYRLKQVDINGKYAYSKTVTIKLKTSGRPIITATPNPVRNSLQIFATQANFKLILTDQNGRTLKTQQLVKGSQYLDVSDLATGSYFLLFSNGDRSFSEKIIKTR